MVEEDEGGGGGRGREGGRERETEFPSTTVERGHSIP